MINVLDLITPPEDLQQLKDDPEGRAALAMFVEIERTHPDFFLFVAGMAGIGESLVGPMDDPKNALARMVNDGKRLLGLEILSVLKVAHEHMEENTNEQ
jgi:hypothetical protein